MEDEGDPVQLSLLTKLRTLLQDPNTPALLDRLSQPELPLVHSNPFLPSTPTSPMPTLLRRMEDSRSSVILKESSSPSEEVRLQKRKPSPPLSESSEKTLMSRLHRPKRGDVRLLSHRDSRHPICARRAQSSSGRRGLEGTSYHA